MVRFAITLAAVLFTSAVTASAQTYPQRPVRFILQFGPGAGVDITARMIADRLSARWGKAVVVENRPGGDGLVAINAFTSANDDHTLLFVPTSAFTAHPYGQPVVGSPAYVQGDAPGISFLDHARVAGLGVEACAPVGCFGDVLVVDEWDPLAQPADGHQLKHYAPGEGAGARRAGRR